MTPRGPFQPLLFCDSVLSGAKGHRTLFSKSLPLIPCWNCARTSQWWNLIKHFAKPGLPWILGKFPSLEVWLGKVLL